ncbi:unnamed protein product [Cylindrotheca closterium]|uniref:Uncharacterized protein n=1 Tax=Cylindrotheca closterium TaxID=2856 RepID=A0AAD2FE42_9STRA|nr:unnamed protein product [Cylindrotheca closterium]
METCYHGGSLPESNLFVVAKNSVGLGGTGDKTESQLKREKERAQKKSLGESVKNPDMNKEHRYTGRTTTELIKRTGEQPPKQANGQELCLIWHTKGECKENCEHDAAPDIDKLRHPAAPMLHRVMKNGAPVVVHSEPWSQSQLDMRVARGCHSSANEFKDFLMEEFLDFGRKGFWILLPYDAIKDEKGLRLSPIGCVPQDNRRPRMIVDYLFWGLNDETMKLARPRQDPVNLAEKNLGLLTHSCMRPMGYWKLQRRIKSLQYGPIANSCGSNVRKPSRTMSETWIGVGKTPARGSLDKTERSSCMRMGGAVSIPNRMRVL